MVIVVVRLDTRVPLTKTPVPLPLVKEREVREDTDANEMNTLACMGWMQLNKAIRHRPLRPSCVPRQRCHNSRPIACRAAGMVCVRDKRYQPSRAVS